MESRRREAAQVFGVTEGAISKAVKGLNIAVVKNVALENAHKVVEKNLNTLAQLQKINAYANDLLDLLMSWNKGDSEALQILESQVQKGKDKGFEEEITEYRFKDPRELALKAMAEIRGQLGLQLDIFKTLYDVEAIAEFQKEVLSAIEEVSPDVRNTIIRRLKERSALTGNSYSRLSDSSEQRDHIPPLSDWVANTPVILDGRPFTFTGHEYLIEPYRDTHPLSGGDEGRPDGAHLKGHAEGHLQCTVRHLPGYPLPLPHHKTDVTDFSKGRVDPLIDENPETIGKWIRDTDSANIKRIWNCFLYLRGMTSRVGLKSVPVDFIVFDELDEAPQNAVDMAMERMGHSEYQEVLKLSPTQPCPTTGSTRPSRRPISGTGC